MSKAKVIFTNGGTVILQLLNEYAHQYLSAVDAAEDYYLFSRMENPEKEASSWEGHDEELLEFEPSHDEIANGGYIVLDEHDIAKIVDDNDAKFWGINMEDFITKLRKLKNENIPEEHKCSNCGALSYKQIEKGVEIEKVLHKGCGHYEYLCESCCHIVDDCVELDEDTGKYVSEDKCTSCHMNK